MTEVVSISGANWVPLKAEYAHDNTIEVRGKKIIWEDGMTAYDHKIFLNDVDQATNRHTMFYLSSSNTIKDTLTEKDLATITGSRYVTVSIDTNSYYTPSIQYITGLDGELYLMPVQTDDCFFRVIEHEDNTISFLNSDGLFITTEYRTPYRLLLQSKVPETENYLQRFRIVTAGTKLFIVSKVLNRASVGPTYEERFWSFSKTGPERKKVKANGGSAEYGFIIDSEEGVFKPTGWVKDHTWVSYHNDIVDKAHNRDLEINTAKSVDDVPINHMIITPYETHVNVQDQTMKVDCMNLKSTFTGEYENGIRNQ